MKVSSFEQPYRRAYEHLKTDILVLCTVVWCTKVQNMGRGYYKGQKWKNENFKEGGWFITIFDPYNSKELIVYLQNKTGALNYYFYAF